MNHKVGKWIITDAVLTLNVILWAIPSNVAYLVAQHRDILLGRYGVSKMTSLIVLIPISILVLVGVWADPKKARQRNFRISLLVISVFLAFFVVDIFLRLTAPKRYLGDQTLFHRVPHSVKKGVFHDVPKTAFAFPATAPGYGSIEYTLTVDKRGFRNPTDADQYDIVILGDSFTEGSDVSDHHVWPVRFAELTGRSVCNLGMSGGNPSTYHQTLISVGLGLQPKLVVCMLYEGNDFRSSNFRVKKRGTWDRFSRACFKKSPLRRAMKDAMIRHLGPIGSRRDEFKLGPNHKQDYDTRTALYKPGDRLYPISWLPLALPDSDQANYYSFDLKLLLNHYVSKDEFQQSLGCRETLDSLHKIRDICKTNSIRLIVMYAPDKPHTLMKLAAETVSPDKVRAFMSLKEDNLPPADQLMPTIVQRMEVFESTIEEFCTQESIEFISLTPPMRQGILSGTQLYLTYNQHWTPPGHDLAALTLQQHLKDVPKTD